MILAVLVESGPDLTALSVSQSQNKIFEKAPRHLDPVCEEALELAQRFRDARSSDRPVLAAYFVGQEREEEVLREALARGADRGIFLMTSEELDPHQKAVALERALAGVSDLGGIFAGGRSPAGSSGETGARVGARLKLPIVVVGREADLEGTRVPACVVTLAGTVKPRLATVMQLMKARQKPLDKVSVTAPAQAWRALVREELV